MKDYILNIFDNTPQKKKKKNSFKIAQDIKNIKVVYYNLQQFLSK